MLKSFMIGLHDKSVEYNQKNIFSLLEKDPEAKLLDLGCDEGSFTLQIANKIGTKYIYGIEIVDERIRKAKNKGVKVSKSDLNKKFPFKDNFFDVVHANQVIEHLIDVDLFAEEIYRVLKPNDYAIISTENLSSWHNLFALFLGYQAFSQHISSKYYIGNPVSPHQGERFDLKSWTHIKIFTYKGLKEFFKVHNFKNGKILGAGHYISLNLFSLFLILDPLHTHFITVKVRK